MFYVFVITSFCTGDSRRAAACEAVEEVAGLVEAAKDAAEWHQRWRHGGGAGPRRQRRGEGGGAGPQRRRHSQQRQACSGTRMRRGEKEEARGRKDKDEEIN